VRYSAFISYNHRDRAWATWLHRELERYRLPKALIGRDSPMGTLERRLPPVFQDREELAASTNLADSVREALSEAHSLIVICSTNGAKSRWVNEEVLQFAAMGRRDRIQCLIVPEADDPAGAPRPGDDVFPPALLDLGDEPLAADARKAGDGKRSAFLKLVAGVIGVRYDELRQREQARRQRRLVTFAAAASVGFLVMTALTVFALLSRAEAVHERDLARQKTITTQRTTDFVKGLFEVSDPSEAKGQSISALEVLDRGARQIQGQLDNEPDVKAELVSTLSEVYMGLGSYRRADNLIRNSLGLAVARPETRARQIGVLAASQSLQADYDHAVRNFSRALELLPRPEDVQDPSLYSRLLVGKAESLAALDRYDEALGLSRRAFEWDRTHNSADAPAIARDLETTALTQQFAGDFAGSRRNYSRALSMRLTAEGKLHPRVAEDLNQLGNAAYLQNDLPAAERYFQQSLRFEEVVLGPNHPDLGITLNNLARVRIEQRKFAAALPLLIRSAKINVAQRDDTHDDLAFIFSNLALAKEGIGDTAEAERLFERALKAARTHGNRLVAPIMVDLADLQCRRGDFAVALDQLSRAAPIMKAQYTDDAWRSAWVQNTRGACLLRQHQATAAKELIESSAPILLKRWPPSTLYGHEVVQRSRMLAFELQKLGPR
jgi:tetratricopeptide (TPR) repeat protein